MQPFHYAAFAEPFGFNSEQDNKVIRFGMYVLPKRIYGHFIGDVCSSNKDIFCRVKNKIKWVNLRNMAIICSIAMR